MLEDAEWRGYFWSPIPHGDETKPLAAVLLESLSDLLFCPEFTITHANGGVSYWKAFPQNDSKWFCRKFKTCRALTLVSTFGRLESVPETSPQWSLFTIKIARKSWSCCSRASRKWCMHQYPVCVSVLRSAMKRSNFRWESASMDFSFHCRQQPSRAPDIYVSSECSVCLRSSRIWPSLQLSVVQWFQRATGWNRTSGRFLCKL